MFFERLLFLLFVGFSGGVFRFRVGRFGGGFRAFDGFGRRFDGGVARRFDVFFRDRFDRRFDRFSFRFRGGALLLDLLRNELAGSLDFVAQTTANLERFRERFGDNIGGALQRFLDGRDALFRVDERRGERVQVGGFVGGVQNRVGERREPLVAGRLRQRLTLRFIRQIQVVQAASGARFANLLLEFRRQFPLRFDRFQERKFAVGQLTLFLIRRGDFRDAVFAQILRLVLAIARDEGNGIPLFQQSDRRFDLVERQFEFASEKNGIDNNGFGHSAASVN